MLEHKPARSPQEEEELLAKLDLPKLAPGDIDWSHAITAVNRTCRFVLPIPAWPQGGEELRFPPESPDAGKIMEAAPDGSAERGLVFFNGVDRAWQTVRADGKDAILINDVAPWAAAKIAAKISELAPSPGELTIADVKELLSFCRDELGAIDMYDKSQIKILAEMAPLGDCAHQCFGYMQCSKPDLHRAVLIEQAFAFDGPVAQRYPEGAVLLNNGKRSWGIGTEVFLRNFRRVGENGGEARITREEMPRGTES